MSAFMQTASSLQIPVCRADVPAFNFNHFTRKSRKGEQFFSQGNGLMWEVKFALIYPRAGRLAGAVLCPDTHHRKE
jgi:hypothetical protein